MLRAFNLTTILMITALILAAPAVAQDSCPEAGEANASCKQYGVHSAESLADCLREASENAGRCADAVYDSLDGSEVKEGGDDSEPGEGATGSPEGKVAGLTMLPETGGAPLLASGVLLVGAGLLARRIIG